MSAPFNPSDPTDVTSDLEIKDAQVIFNTVWRTLTEDVGHEHLTFPKELILLGGAPGAGKGTHTRFIMQARGLTCPPIVVSNLLNTPEAQKIKDDGRMVGDQEVVGIVLRELLKEQYRDGAVLDGFPRTSVQVECLKMLVDRVVQLHGEYADTPLAINFRRPTIHAMVLFVGEKTSVDRQLQRGKEIEAYNREVTETGIGRLHEVRSTDLDPEKARRRYQVFKEKTWDALQSLKEIYHYHFINAEGAIDEVEANILRELQYQSSLELDPRTFDRLSPIPLAEEIIIHARQDLVRRLDSYELEHSELFGKVVELVESRFMPIITRHALSGRAIVNNEDSLFDDPLALAMLIDIFSERGFNACVDKTIRKTPNSVDLQTGTIGFLEHSVYRIHIRFEGSSIRRG
ncbi:nucleoside monophosphate kinase [Mariniblastus fucicola]|uniref:Adenylate kinase n=1 Tax=Mariniblastus fucicola TaxID=980251 RepID=A0A5B9P9P3_9BACT|nr:nucleoside monophosphate kinase [Mariniblastus fucicola]QEG22179.1 Adenylate kinase [Mariniblastus fucicola]